MESSSRLQESGPLSFHEGTEDRLFEYVEVQASKGNINSLLEAIDKFCYTQHWMMHCGDEKRGTLIEAFHQARERYLSNDTSIPFTVAELGSYCGYSAVVLGSLLRHGSGDHLYCIEANARCVNWTRRLIQFSQLEQFATVIESEANNVTKWSKSIPTGTIHLLFLDHDKKSYCRDLQAIITAGLLAPGATTVADNVLCFNRPTADYLKFVRNPCGPFVSSVLHPGFLEYTTKQERENSDNNLVDGIEVSIFHS